MSTVTELPIAAEGALESATSPTKKSQHPRDKVVSILGQLKPVDGVDTPSGRELARRENIPESTLRGWRKRLLLIGLESEVIAFFESPPGIRFLHRLATDVKSRRGGAQTASNWASSLGRRERFLGRAGSGKT